jgi:hypothetical protein
MSKKKPSHLHLYKRKNLTRDFTKPPFIVLACTKPFCSHWLRIDLAIGKECECNRCHQPMLLDKHTITLSKPHCQKCIKHKHKPEIDKLSQLVDEL